MAVPGGRNGMEEENDGIVEVVVGDWANADVPPHLQDLAAAAESGDLEALRSALDNLNGSIDQPIEDGDTALHLCCLYGHLSSVQLLLERGANLEAKDEDGAIPLHDACAGGFTDIVQLLINAASPDCVERMLNTVDVEGDTPLHHATRGDHLPVVHLLLAAGASRTRINIYGKTPAELADPDTEVRSFLEGAGVDAPATTP